MNTKEILLSAVWVLCVAPCAFGADVAFIEAKYKRGRELFLQAQEASKGKLEPAFVGQDPDRVAYRTYKQALCVFQSCCETFSGDEKDFRSALMLTVTYAHLAALSERFGTPEEKGTCLRLSRELHEQAQRLFRRKYSKVFVDAYEDIDIFIGMDDEDLNSSDSDFSRHFIEHKVDKEEFLQDFYFVYGYKTGHNQRNTFGVTLTVEVANLWESR